VIAAYEGSSLRKSCNSRNSSIPHPCHYPCQVHMIFLLLGEGDHFPNSESAHTRTIILPYSRLTVIRYMVLPSTSPAIIICMVLPSTSQGVIICTSHPSTTQVASRRIVFSFHSTYWFSRPRVLGRHHTDAPNLKDVFLCVWCDRYNPGSTQFTCGGFNPR